MRCLCSTICSFSLLDVTWRSFKAVRWLNMLSHLTFDSNKKLQKIVQSRFDAIFHMIHKFQVCFGNIDEKYNQNSKKFNMVQSTLLQCVSSTGLWLLWGHLLKCVASTPKLDVLNDLKSSTVVFALSSQYYLLIQSIRRYVTEFRSGALAEHVVPIDVGLEQKIAKNCAKSFWCNISCDA